MKRFKQPKRKHKLKDKTKEEHMLGEYKKLKIKSLEYKMDFGSTVAVVTQSLN